MNGPGWRTSVEGVEVHLPSVIANGMLVDFWRRSEVGATFGRWTYVKILADCNEGTQIPFATIDAHTGFFVHWADADDRTLAAWHEDAKSKRIMQSICSLYGRGKPEIGSITRLPNPQK